MYINKFETFVDTDNIYWKTVDLFITTKQEVDLCSIKERIFQNCYLRETISTNTGKLNREDLKKQKEEEIRARRNCFILV